MDACRGVGGTLSGGLSGERCGWGGGSGRLGAGWWWGDEGMYLPAARAAAMAGDAEKVCSACAGGIGWVEKVCSA